MTILQDDTSVSLEASYAWCRALTRRTAGNFYFSFLTLPAAQRRDMCALYAFMRVSDDIGDNEAVPISQRMEQLCRWRSSLQRAVAGETREHPSFPALADVVRRHEIPEEYLFALIDGVRDDLEPAAPSATGFRPPCDGGPPGDGWRNSVPAGPPSPPFARGETESGVKPAARFETFAELSEYCYRVAGVVGLCCIHLWGFHDERAADRAVDCGMAFQLTNILRDLAEDARRGRVYLPREDLKTFDYSAEDIAEGRRDDRFVELMRFEVDRARSYYRKAEELFRYLDRPGRSIYSAMLGIYGGLLEEIERRNYDVYTKRVQLPGWRKLLIALRAMAKHRWFGRG